MQLTQHDEINLFRLVRRLEKAVQSKDGWEAEEGGDDDIRVKARKELQKVKYARKLARNVEAYEQGSRCVPYFGQGRLGVDPGAASTYDV